MTQEQRELKMKRERDAEDYLAYMKVAHIRAVRKIERENITDPLEVINIYENESRAMKDRYKEEVGDNEFAKDDSAAFRYELKNKYHLASKQIKAIEQEC